VTDFFIPINPNTIHGSFIHDRDKIVEATYFIPETAKMGGNGRTEDHLRDMPLK